MPGYYTYYIDVWDEHLADGRGKHFFYDFTYGNVLPIEYKVTE